MKYYVGIDLHSNNSYIAIIDADGKLVFKKRTKNNITTIVDILKVFKTEIFGIVVESTFNWYWLVDGLQEAGFKVHLCNPYAADQYNGLKHSDDKTDAIWLAEMLRLKILPTGYIYPKAERPIRDLLRRRMFLVQHRTSLIVSLKGMMHNWTGERLKRSEIKKVESVDIERIFNDEVNQESAKMTNDVIKVVDEKICKLEESIYEKIKLKSAFKKLKTVWGIGELLAAMIMLETGDIKRFKDAGHYASYCRCVSSKRISNEKKKGSGNRKNGNKYLSWAFIEVANFAIRYYPKAKAWFDKKCTKKGRTLAIKALSNKLARACYFVLRDQEPFVPEKLFG